MITDRRGGIDPSEIATSFTTGEVSSLYVGMVVGRSAIAPCRIRFDDKMLMLFSDWGFLL
jgi:hypothetical protein